MLRQSVFFRINCPAEHCHLEWLCTFLRLSTGIRQGGQEVTYLLVVQIIDHWKALPPKFGTPCIFNWSSPPQLALLRINRSRVCWRRMLCLLVLWLGAVRAAIPGDWCLLLLLTLPFPSQFSMDPSFSFFFFLFFILFLLICCCDLPFLIRCLTWGTFSVNWYWNVTCFLLLLLGWILWIGLCFRELM